MSLIIHMLEACVAVLSALLGWQVARQYKLQVDDFAKEVSSGISGSAIIAPQGVANATSKPAKRIEPFLEQEPSALKQPSAVKESAAFVNHKVSTRVADKGVTKAEAASSALDILDDYIGGFFDTAGSSEVEIKAFRSVDEQEVESYYRSDAGNDHIAAIAPAIDLTKYKASTADTADQIPVLRTPIPESLITERFLEQMKELDEEVILVEEKQEVVARDSVMSDKVVLAMLDEAKLVGTN